MPHASEPTEAINSNWLSNVRDWVDIIFKLVLAVAGAIVGYYFSFEKQQNDDIKLIVDMATDSAAPKRAMSGPIAKAYFEQHRIPQDVYVAIYSYVNLSKEATPQQASFNKLVAASASADPSLAAALAKADASLPVRIYVQVRQEADRAQAKSLADRISAAALPNGQSIVVPGIELVTGQTTRTILKCFHHDECETIGKTLVKMIQSYSVSVDLSDQSGIYENSKSIRPNTFEIWLKNGFSGS